MNNKRNIFVAVIIVGVAVIIYYRAYFIELISSNYEKVSPTKSSLDVVLPRELSAVAKYTVPGGEDVLKFSLFVDENGLVTNVQTKDVLQPTVSNEKLIKFSEGLLLTIKGKKLSDINNIDRVGTSSLTTKAFNSALAELKAQL